MMSGNLFGQDDKATIVMVVIQSAVAREPDNSVNVVAMTSVTMTQTGATVQISSANKMTKRKSREDYQQVLVKFF